MSEIATDKTIRVGKDTYGYGDEKNNYIAPRELTVTITLDEYRALVKKNAQHDQTIADIRENYDNKIRKLNEELNFLKMQAERIKEVASQSDSDDDEEQE